MGYGALIQEAVEDASNDMGNVQQAADAISTAIGKVTPLPGGKTWTGGAADKWEGDWQSPYRAVQSVLGDLPSAESSVINDTRAQMEQTFSKQHTPA